MSIAILIMFSSQAFSRVAAISPGFIFAIIVYDQNANLSAAAVGAGNTYMTEIAKKAPTKR